MVQLLIFRRYLKFSCRGFIAQLWSRKVALIGNCGLIMSLNIRYLAGFLVHTSSSRVRNFLTHNIPLYHTFSFHPQPNHHPNLNFFSFLVSVSKNKGCQRHPSTLGRWILRNRHIRIFRGQSNCKSQSVHAKISHTHCQCWTFFVKFALKENSRLVMIKWR